MLNKIAENLWTVDYPLKFMGLPIETRMSVIRVNQRELVVVSPIQVSDELVAALAELGEVKYIIAPNLYHHLFAAAFAASYPEAQFWVVDGMQAKRPDLKPDRYLTEPAGDVAADVHYRNFPAFRVRDLPGNMPFNEYVFLHRPSRSLILTDTAFHFGPESHWSVRLLAKALGIYGKLQPSQLERWALRDPVSAEATIREILSWDFDRVIMAHGSIIESQGKRRLQAGYEWYLRKSLAV
ncbi:DUF4336 domain-containing protein [filamentous cyanobacterium LEGE 11480]|uniref:DUF4336 domain-containing protein n=1 Tax=Romeriopsis navalis LEGE 11480 TaxID=2777977 RepID=A0A928Z5Z3_9CYAN|nr:DUF4336 domain-containing protein [Romeriopsis navalis]MBE9032507.1 DUF4336 domain-containing protein [Romeriopsis navalis LEGE 11480]